MIDVSEPQPRELRRALIRFEGGRGQAPCIVHDVSIDGAQLLVASTSGIPSEFKLIIDDEPARPCFVRWRRHTRLGVQFLSPGLASLAG